MKARALAFLSGFLVAFAFHFFGWWADAPPSRGVLALAMAVVFALLSYAERRPKGPTLYLSGVETGRFRGTGKPNLENVPRENRP